MRTEKEQRETQSFFVHVAGQLCSFSWIFSYPLGSSSWIALLCSSVLWLSIRMVNSKDGGLFPRSLFLVALLFSHKLCPILLWPPWTVACQAPLSLGFSRQEYWNGLPYPSPEDFLDPGIELASPALAGGFFTTGPRRSCFLVFSHLPIRRISGFQGNSQKDGALRLVLFAPILVH